MHEIRQYYIVLPTQEFLDELRLIDGLSEALIEDIKDAFKFTKRAPITVDSFVTEINGKECIATPLRVPFRSRYIAYQISNEYIKPMFIGRTPLNIQKLPPSR